MTYLLDVNVLIALLDPAHVHYSRAHSWFHETSRSWSSCPITEAGVVRILSQITYPNSPGTPREVIELLRNLYKFYQHEFWPDSLSLVTDKIFSSQIRNSTQVTDAYLLALAVTNEAQLATFDSKIDFSVVIGGDAALLSSLE